MAERERGGEQRDLGHRFRDPVVERHGDRLAQGQLAEALERRGAEDVPRVDQGLPPWGNPPGGGLYVWSVHPDRSRCVASRSRTIPITRPASTMAVSRSTKSRFLGHRLRSTLHDGGA